MKNCAFTICSKNYLAQALTLRDSFKSNNPDKDFYLFLADSVTNDVNDLDVVPLNTSWIPKWKEMAFKYDIIEFNTSIKPFCFQKLFSEGYEKVIYLDPDIYIVTSLVEIYDWLSNYSVVLSPHISYLQKDYTGAQTDISILGVGLYNLGFCAIKNSKIGNSVVEWWMDRLEKYCYGTQPLFVDQKWMIFVPLFYPKDTLITKHAGINTAIWNLHERTLLIENDRYMVEDIVGDKYPLLFYHFSGFDPDVPKVINRRHAKFNTDTYPSFKPIIEEYRKKILDNGYYKYHPMDYAFVSFDNGLQICGFTRLLFRHFLELHPDFSGDPFDSKGEFFNILKNRRCLVHTKSNGVAVDMKHQKESDKIQKGVILPILKLTKYVFGIKAIMKIRGLANRLSDRKVYNFLLED